MKEYQFKFTKVKDTVLVLVACLIIFAIIMFVGFNLSMDKSLLTVIEIIAMFLTFRLLKKRAVSSCTAKLTDESVEFVFQNDLKIVNFSDLKSFKAYFGKNGPILYLKSKDENFKISANNNFCETDDFCTFCVDTIAQLDKYKGTHKTGLIHGGSIFATKAMLYFLITTTVIYLALFFFESKALQLAVGIAGGLYLGIMWTSYFLKRDKGPE